MCLSNSSPIMKRVFDAGPAVLAVERGDLAVDLVPIDLAGQQNQLVLHVDDLVQPRPEQIVRTRRLVLLRCTTDSWFAAKGNLEGSVRSRGTRGAACAVVSTTS